MRHEKILCGADRLLSEDSFRDSLEGRKIAAVVNHTAVTADYAFWPLLLGERTGAALEVIFAPEHGLWGQEQDQVPVRGERRGPGGVPVRSLYGGSPESLEPRPEELAGLDSVIFDIQDVGSRYYTYIYTLAYVMEAASKAGIEVVVLDRPNPLGGELVEGPPLEPGYESFVGRFAGLPVRHGLTAGEMALWFHRARGIGEIPLVVEVSGWSRGRTAFDSPAAPWVAPSPNMPAPETALVYPGMCLLEGTNLSEGRGTTRPFEIFGAPWLDAFALADELNSLALPGVRFRPHRFRPTFADYAGTLCSGCQVHVTDREAFRPLLTGATVIRVAAMLKPQVFSWLERPYEFVSHIPAIDLLFGSDRLRRAVEGGCRQEELEELCSMDAASWHGSRKECLLY